MKFYQEWFFNLYLKLYTWEINRTEHYNHTVCDHLGPIDTLGYSGSQGRLTYSYSCELYSEFGIILFPLPVALVLHDGYSKCLYWRMFDCRVRTWYRRFFTVSEYDRALFKMVLRGKIKDAYRARHKKDLDTKDFKRAGFLSYYLLWGDNTSLKQNIEDYKKKFNLS